MELCSGFDSDDTLNPGSFHIQIAYESNIPCPLCTEYRVIKTLEFEVEELKVRHDKNDS